MQVTLIGAGNTAWHFGHAMLKAGITVHQVFNRRPERGIALSRELNSRYIGDLNEISGSDLILLAVSDSAIPDILRKLAAHDIPLVHTSGSVEMMILKGCATSYGVIYPFQSLTYGIPLDFKRVPLCMEASDPSTSVLLGNLAHKLSDSVHFMDSGQRQKLHLSGILANNFSNHLITLAKSFLRENKLDGKLLDPMIEETFEKLKRTEAYLAQTGPARRKDMGTIEKHLDMLDNNPVLKNLYGMLSDSIIAHYPNK
jgi:predicted short-subunit dehydrogenase-like oxidoreductase (DUF2520 family)